MVSFFKFSLFVGVFGLTLGFFGQAYAGGDNRGMLSEPVLIDGGLTPGGDNRGRIEEPAANVQSQDGDGSSELVYIGDCVEVVGAPGYFSCPIESAEPVYD